MKKDYVFVVLSNPVHGREQSYNTWYSETHLKDMLKVPGFTQAQRYRAAGVSGGGTAQFEYMAVYEARTDAPQEMLDEVLRCAGSERMPIDEGMDANYFAVIYEAITPMVKAQD